MPLCSELMSRPKKAVAGSRPERTTPGGSSRAGRGRQYCKLRWLLSPVIGIFQCIFELKMPRPVIWQRFTSTNSCHEPPLAGELEPADRPAIRGKCALGWVCRPPLWVWWSSLVGGSISLLGLCLLGSSLRAGALDFIVTRNRTFCFSGPLRVCLSSRYLRPVL